MPPAHVVRTAQIPPPSVGRLGRLIRQFLEVEAPHGAVEVGGHHAHAADVLVHLDQDEHVVCLEIHFVPGPNCLGHQRDGCVPGNRRVVPDVWPDGKLLCLGLETRLSALKTGRV